MSPRLDGAVQAAGVETLAIASIDAAWRTGQGPGAAAALREGWSISPSPGSERRRAS